VCWVGRRRVGRALVDRCGLLVGGGSGGEAGRRRSARVVGQADDAAGRPIASRGRRWRSGAQWHCSQAGQGGQELMGRCAGSAAWTAGQARPPRRCGPAVGWSWWTCSPCTTGSTGSIRSRRAVRCRRGPPVLRPPWSPPPTRRPISVRPPRRSGRTGWMRWSPLWPGPGLRVDRLVEHLSAEVSYLGLLMPRGRPLASDGGRPGRAPPVRIGGGARPPDERTRTCQRARVT
jgi:hypothetical protein